MLPVLEKFASARRVLIAGCGGGFDVFAGVPIALRLARLDKEIVLANLSFTNLWMCGEDRLTPITWRVGEQSKELPYFPEKWLAEWLGRRGLQPPIYAFADSGVRPLAAAYRAIMDDHDIDLVVLIDAGTDSVLFGDEPGLGTVVEDAVSVVAAHAAGQERVILGAIGFGVDHHHGVSHHAFLENAARLAREGGFLGSFALAPGMHETDAFLDLVDYANRRQPQHRSVVCNSIAGALRGEFGDYRANNRTSGSELFINPLMSQYWFFEAGQLVADMIYADELAETEQIEDARRIIDRRRAGLEPRPRRNLPL